MGPSPGGFGHIHDGESPRFRCSHTLSLVALRQWPHIVELALKAHAIQLQHAGKPANVLTRLIRHFSVQAEATEALHCLEAWKLCANSVPAKLKPKHTHTHN